MLYRNELSDSPTSVGLRSPLRAVETDPQTHCFESAGVGLILKMCFSGMFSGDANANSPGLVVMFRKPLY